MDVKSIRNHSSLNALEHTFSVYSNEIENAIYIDLHANDPNICYTVYNKNGEVVKENHNLSKRNTLSLHPFPSGLYTIEITGRKKTIVKKILKF